MDSCEEYIDMTDSGTSVQNNDMLFTWSGGFLKPNWIGESRHSIERDLFQLQGMVRDC